MANEKKATTVPELTAEFSKLMQKQIDARKAQLAAYAASAYSRKNPPNYAERCKTWAIKDGWSLREAANLLSRCDPERPSDLEGQKPLNIEVDKLYRYMLSHAKKSLVLADADTLLKVNYRVRPLMLLQWAASHDVAIPWEVFVAVIAPINAKVVRPKEHLKNAAEPQPANGEGGPPAQVSPTYTTRLLKAQQAAIEKFWVKFDGRRPPRTEEVVEWLMHTFEISKRAAVSIDLIIRSDERKSGGLIRRRPT